MNQCHYVLGYLSPILACVTIFFGIYDRTRYGGDYWYWYFLVGLWIIILFPSFMILAVIQFIYEKTNETSEKDNKFTEEDDDDQENWSSDDEREPAVAAESPPDPNNS